MAPPPSWRRAVRALAPFFGVALFVLALIVIQRELAALGYREVAREVGTLPGVSLLFAVLLTFLGFAVLATYDVLAIRYAQARLPHSRIAFASFVGYALSQALGSPLLTGVPLRYRLYSSWGLSTVDITRVVAFLVVTSWVGLLMVMAGALLVGPEALALSTPLSEWTLRALGIACLLGILTYGAWAAFSRRPIRVASWEFAAPSAGLMSAQLMAGIAEWLTVAGVLYVLLPAGHGLAYFQFVSIYAVAQMVAQVSHVPGGLGVFEAMLLVLVPETVSEGGLVASLLAFRIIYYLLPLFAAAGCLGSYELRQRRQVVERTVDALGRGVSMVVPLILSGTVFLAGVLLLFTGALPVPEGRLAWLGRVLPLSVIEISHFLASLVGGGLLFLAWGLRHRLGVAYRLTLLLLAVGVVLSVTRGLGWIQGGVLTAVFLFLLPARREFFREAALAAVLPSRQWILLVGVTLASTVWLGLFAYRRVDLSSELWWEFALRGDAPRFLRAGVGVAALFVAYGLSRLLRTSRPGDFAETPRAPLPEVELVVDTSDRAHAALVYLNDKQVLLSKSRRAMIMYGVEGRSWVSLGDPLGDPEDHDELIWRFRKLVFRHGGWPVFYQVRPECLPLYVDVGLTPAKLGEEAYVPLEGFTLEGGARKNLRRTVRKVEGDGATFELLPAGAGAASLPELRDVSDAWLREKSTREKGFSLGFFDEDYLLRTPLAFLRVDGRIVAFANVLAGGSGEELTADLMRYGPGAPPSSMEYLFVQLMLWGSEEGYRRFSLGMAPLSGLDTRPFAPLWNRLGAAVFRYGEHFYNFQGLRAYKEKFDPVWEPRYLVSPGGLAFPRVLTNLATLIAGGVRGVLTR